MSIYKRYASNVIVESIGSANTITFQNSGGTANVIVTGDLTVTGNASLAGNISGDKLFNGTTSIEIQTPNGNANITIGGTSNVAVFSTGGANITGYMSASGNVTGANINTAGLLTAVGNVTGGNINSLGNVWITRDASVGQPTIRFTDTDTDVADGQVFGAVEWYTNDVSSSGARVTAGIRAVASGLLGNANVQILTSTGGAAATAKVTVDNVGNVGIANAAPLHTLAVSGTMYGSSTLTAVGNVTGGNLSTAGLITATGNVTGGNINTGGLITATGNITGGNIVSSAGIFATAGGTNGIVSAVGNIRGGNINSDGAVSATGNVNGDNINAGTLFSGPTAIIGNANITTNMFGGGIGVENIVWQSVAANISSASMANVGSLGFLALAGRSYKFEAYMPVIPTGPTTTAFSTYFDAGSCSYTVETQQTATTGFAMATSNTSATTGTTQSMTGTTPRTVRITGIIYSAGNANVAIQGQTSAANITLPSGSYLTYTRIG